MKKIFTLIFISLGALYLYSQESSYGLLLNTNYYDVAVKNGSQIGGEVTQPPFGIGVFYDYNFSNNLGFKTNLFFSSNKERYHYYQIGSNSRVDLNKKSIQVSPHLKYDVRKEYNKGFYLMSGPRLSFVLSAKDNDGNKIEDFYKKVDFGIQLGFGFNFLKHFGFEILGDYGLNDISKTEPIVKTAGIHANLTINLEPILNK
ncbi:porin family protein [Algibacter sp.]|uniref:porin family protein n=1 Tax=Algibacter sp. TaxID=1872428 RepID=UPI003C778B83